MTVRLPAVDDLRAVPLAASAREDGRLYAAEAGKHLTAPPDRMFFVVADADGAVRGRHAVMEGGQTLICPRGALTILVHDGTRERAIHLGEPDRGVFVPPMLWLEVTLRSAGDILLVLCGQPWEERLYVRDFRDFLDARGLSPSREGD